MFVSSFQAFQYNKTLFLYFLSLILSLSHLPLYVHIIQMRSAYQDRACGPDQTFHRGSILKKLRRFDATFLQIFRCKKGYVQTPTHTHTLLLSALGPGNLPSLPMSVITNLSHHK